jgi:hypothetical protein
MPNDVQDGTVRVSALIDWRAIGIRTNSPQTQANWHAEKRPICQISLPVGCLSWRFSSLRDARDGPSTWEEAS